MALLAEGLESLLLVVVALTSLPGPLPYQTGHAFNDMWAQVAADAGRQAMETTTLTRANDVVKLAAMVKGELRMQNVIANLANQVGQAAAGNAQAVADLQQVMRIVSVLLRLPSMGTERRMPISSNGCP